MLENEAYQKISERTGIAPALIPVIPELTLDLPVLNPIRPDTLKQLGQILDLRPGQHVMDLACGKAGASIPLVHIYRVKLLGIDLMPEYIREAWAKAEHTGLYDLCDFRIEDGAYVLQVAQGQWDAMLILGALPFLGKDMDNTLEAAVKLVKSGGHLVIGLPYLKENGSWDSGFPIKSKEETTAWLGKTGGVVSILDDGDEGWDYYIQPQSKAAGLIKKNNPGDTEMANFINGWLKELNQEKQNAGFAVWVLKIEK